MTPVYIIHAFPERREAMEFELTEHGQVAAEAVRWIAAPRGIEARSQGLYACRRWRDPHARRLLTWGEMACIAGHLEAWKQIAAGDASGAFILEDDARILRPLADAPVRGDLTYLGGKCLADPGRTVDGLIEAPYTYWTVGYWLSREAAGRLAAAVRSGNIIPVDEFLPYHYGRNPNVNGQMGQADSLGLAAWALPQWMVEPSGRFSSETEESPSCFTLDTYVFATDPAQAGEALEAYRGLDYRPQVLGSGEPGWDTNGTGGMQKLRWLHQALESLLGLRSQGQSQECSLRHSVVLAVDGYDTLAVAPADNLLQRFAEMQADLVVSGERTCWPDQALAARFDALAGEDPAPYRYPCSGAVMGFGASLLNTLSAAGHPGESDDQLYLQRRILSDPGRWRVDREAYLFQSINHAEAEIGRQRGNPFNQVTQCYPAILHANGPSNLEAARPLPWTEPGLAAHAFDWMEVADGVLGMPFLDQETCTRLCAVAELVDSLWQPLPGDNVPGDELRLKRLDLALWDWLGATLKDRLGPIINARWRPALWHDLSDAFLIRYSPDKQPSLRLHEDISYLSCSVRLRRSCRGGELIFPRQNFSDGLIPDGWLLVWPARITHPHQVLPVRKGKRISLVVWTSER